MNDFIIVPRDGVGLPIAPSIADDPRFIPDDPHKQRVKRTLVILLILLLGLGGSVSLLTVFKDRNPIAEIRQFAAEPESVAPQTSFSDILPTQTPVPALVSPTTALIVPTTAPRRGVSPTRRPVNIMDIFQGDPTAPTATPRGFVPTQRPVAQTNTTGGSTTTPTVVPSNSNTNATTEYRCQQILLYRDGENLTLSPEKIKYGDSVHFLAYVPNTGTVKNVTFAVDINGVHADDVVVPVGLHDNTWVADFVHIFNQPGSHRVYIKSISSL